MPLPGSGAISLLNLQNEFGGSNPIGLNEYYRNGGLVGSHNTNVPASGAIALSQFYGATGTSPGPTSAVKLTPITIQNTLGQGQGASLAGLALERSGKLMAYANQYAGFWFEINPADEWLNPESLADADFFECRAIRVNAVDLNSFADHIGYLDAESWSRLGTGGSTRYWWTENHITTLNNDLFNTYRIQIRNRITMAVVVDVNILHIASIYTEPNPGTHPV